MPLSEIEPRERNTVYDLAMQAGLDVSDWGNYAKGPRYAASNPKYCYEWAFVQPNRFVILNLWYKRLSEANGLITNTQNPRAASQQTEKAPWAKRAKAVDDAVHLAWREKLPIRAIICDGEVRAGITRDAKASSVSMRFLDPIPWAVTSYETSTGQFTVTRGAQPARYVDQFSAELDLSMPEGAAGKRTREVEVRERSAKVRESVLDRASGVCERCHTRGFITASGNVYLETHHVVPLCEDGPDHPSNVVAICANDHKEAHHGANRELIRAELLAYLAECYGQTGQSK